jgi:hypothetical protein
VDPQLFPFEASPPAHVGTDGPAYFLVSSSGHSGSIWLAGSLNLHDEVLANVGLGHPLQAFDRYALHKDLAFITEHASQAFVGFGFHRPTQYLPALPGVETLPDRDLYRLPWYVFDELEQVPAPRPYRCFGNVHGLLLAHVFPAWQSDPTLFRGRRVACMDLIRHPVPRTESAIRATLWLHMEESEPAAAAYIDAHAAECLDLERRYGIDLDEPRARAALIVYRISRQNDAWAAELRDYPQVRRILLERLQGEPEY